MQCTASTSGDLSGSETPKISEYIDFTFITGAGIMTMLGWAKRNWAHGLAFPIVLVA